MHNEAFSEFVDYRHALPRVSGVDIGQLAEHDVKGETECIRFSVTSDE